MIEKTIDSNGFKLRYVREGSGIPLLIIGSSYYYPRVFSKDFRNHYDCVFMDHRGFMHPPGKVDLSEFNLDVLLGDIELIRQDTKFEKAIILGHSGHGYLALEYAKKYPDHVLGVAIIATGPNQSDESNKAAEEYFQKNASEERKKVLEENLKYLPQELEKHPEKALITMLIRLSAKGWYDYTFDPSPLWKDVVVNMQMFNYVWGDIFKKIDITKGLETFNKPVFLGLGKWDFIVAPPHLWCDIIPKFNKIDAYIFEKSGHTPQYEEAKLFDKEFSDWVTKNIKM